MKLFEKISSLAPNWLIGNAQLDNGELGMVVLFVAIDKEHEAVCAKLAGPISTYISDDDLPYEYGFHETPHGRWRVFICQTGDGNSNAAAIVAQCLAALRPHISFYCGIAGGIKDVGIGDVVVGDTIYFYDRIKETDTATHSRPKDTRPANHRMLQMAQIAARVAKRNGKAYKIYQKPIAAGGALVATSAGAVRTRLNLHFNDAIAVENEGTGYMLSTHIFETPALVIRGISDLLDKKDESDGAGHQELAAANAADFTFLILSQFQRAPVHSQRNEVTMVQWEQALGTLHHLYRDIEATFRPDLIITMSGPGSWAAFYCMSLRPRNAPTIAAVTFPRRDSAQSELSDFEQAIDSQAWIRLDTDRWHILIPNIFLKLRKDAKILIFDDRVLTGNSQRELKSLLANMGFKEVKTAALFSKKSAADARLSLDFVGHVFDGDFETPWGKDRGRI